MTTREPSTRRAANRSPRSVVWRLLAALVALTLSILGMATPAHAAAAADIAKELDATQGRGFTSPDTFEVGALVRYRITVSCSSLDTACVTGTVTDVLDPNLQFVQVIAPVAKNNDGQTLPITTTTSGQTVTTTVGSSAAPLQGGNSLELVLVARVKSTPASGTIPNQASIAVPGAPTVNSEIVTIKVPPTQPRYQISKSGSDNVAPGEPATYYLRLGGSQFSNVDIVLPMTIVDTYPAGATVVSTDGGVVDTANHTITWTVTSLPYQIASNPGGSCDYTGWCTVWGVTVVLKYNSPTFSGGQTVTNSVVTDPTYTSGDLPPLTSSKDTGIVASAPSANVSKYGPTEASPGNTVEWFVTSTNNGNSTLANYAVTDTLPAGVTNVSIFSTSYDQPLYPPSLGPVTFEALVGGTWQQIGTYSTTGDWSNGESMALPSGATAWRMVVASLPADAVMNMKVKADIPATATTGDTFKNCAAVSSTTAGTSLGQDSCVTTTITTPFVGFQPYKAHHFNDSTQTSVIPGETFLWGIGVIPSGPNPVTSLDFADVLPPQFEYVTTRCLAAYGSGYGIQTSLEQVIAGYTWQGPGCDKAGVPQASTVTVNPDGSTSLAWQDVPIDSTGQPSILFDGGSLWWVVFEVRVKPGTAVANYTNQMAVGTGGTDLQTRCAVTGASWAWMRSGWSASWYDAVDPLNPDSADWDKDGNTTETLCRQNDAVQVRLAAAADTTKWDKGPLPNALQSTGQPDPTCPDWGGFTRYPCVAQTNPGGAFAYRFNIQNTGNMTLTNYVGYDILPYLGDTGVGQLLSTQSRATEWVPVLTGPLTVESQPATAGTQILYNLTTNPCRPELATGASDATWQASCDNTWYTAAQISDWSTVKSFKVVAFQNGAVWDAAQQIILQAPMLAPTTAPDSIKSPLDLSIAWNSIAHREFKINSDGTTARLLAAEPLKVGIIVPFAGVSVGDYVWMDSNRDGVQSPGELPIKDVKVELLDASGAVVQTTTTDASGYYSFQYLDKSAQYTIRFTAPTGLLFTKTNAGGVTSNDPVADNGSTALDGTTGGDSDAVVSTDGLTGSVTFTSPATGTNKVSDPVAGTVADNPGLDAGFVPASIPVSIGDFVWFDANRDGQQSAGEPVVPGVTVNLYDSAGTKVGSTTTDSTGYYWFTDLVADAKYTVEFVKPAGTALTTQNSGADATDSDADLVTGKVSVTAPASGSNVGAAEKADDPTIDAGLVKYNLTLAKSVTSSGPYFEGSTVTFALAPHNDGPVDALAGWSVTDILPAGLTLVSMTGTGYTCTGATCVGDSVLAAGADGGVITVTATVDAGFVGSLHNVAYVSPSSKDTVETNPLVVPSTTTDTSTTGTDNDAQATVSVASLVSIGDFVWFDTNRDGQQSAGEPVVPGVTVNLYDSSGALKSSTATDSTGYYWFTGLTPGAKYTVEFVKPAGTAFTTQNSGADGTDSDADLVTGKVSVTAPVSGSNVGAAGKADDPTVDAGLVKLNLSLAKALTASGPFYAGSTVTFSLTPHNDGPVDALAGWSVTDILPAGLTLVSMTGTGYTCTGATCVGDSALAAGKDGAVITVTATVDAAFVGSLHNVAYVAPATGETAETNPLVVPTTGTDTSGTTTDNDAQADLLVDSLVSIGDFVWFDTNRDGQQSAGEPFVPGVTVNLLDGAGTVVKTATTDAAGYYVFADLVPGTAYTVEFVKPAGTSFTTATTGASATDSNADPATGKVSVTAPASGVNGTDPGMADDPTIDAGLVKYNLTLVKAYTTVGPVYEGSTVTFTLTPGNDGPVDALAGWSVTDVLPSGLTLVSMAGTGYTCTGATCVAAGPLAAGTFGNVITVTATIDANFTGSAKNVAYVSPSSKDAVETNPLVVPTTTTDTSSTPTDNDAQAPISVSSLVSVGDYAWVDVNRDGLQTPLEPVLAGVVVTLTDAGGATRSTTTDASGYYWFDDLTPGAAYTITFTAPAGYAFTTQTVAGGDPAKDSNADPVTGAWSFTAPAAGVNQVGALVTDDPTIDAGFVKLNLSLTKALVTAGPFYAGGSVEFTLTPHNDGPVDALAGWSVTDILPSGLTLTGMSGAGYACDLALAKCSADAVLAAGADGAVITVTATIDARFVGGLHNVAYVAPAAGETVETNPLVVPSTDTDTDSTDTDNDAQAPLVVDSLVSVGDYVWVDVNRDGLQDGGEPVMAGVTVNLLDSTGTVIRTTTTGSDGYYWFDNLVPGTPYTVQFVKPAGMAFTTANSGDDTVDSDADVVTGTVDFVAPASGSNDTAPGLTDNPTLDAGVIQLNLSLVKSLTATGPFYAGSTVTFDLTPHNDGPVDALAGWSVTDILPSGLTLVSMSGSGYDCQVLTATCTAAGILGAGADGATITVTATVDAAFVGTLHNVAYVSPAAGETAETNPLVVPDTTTDTAATGTDNDAQAPLVVDSLVSIGDYVWVDTNRDGLQDSGEAALAGVTVTLYAADGATVLATAVTDANGKYSFVDLTPGQHYVVEFSAPGYAFTTANSGNDAADSDADVVTGRVDVTAPASGVNGATNPDDPTIDAGVIQLNLVLAKSLTATGPFYAGSTVTFALTPHNDGPVDALTGWSVTDILPSGLTLVSMTGSGYTCTGATCVADGGLPAGTDGPVITVTATIDHAFVGTLHNVAYVSPSAQETTETNPLVVPSTDTNTDTTPTDNDAQAPLEVLSLVSVGDFVWLDVNRDGIQDSTEPVIAGVTVTLTDATGAVVATTTTDANGFYSFVDLVPGATYTITFTRPAGYTFTSQTSGTNTAVDSNADLATGAWTFTAPASGKNSATEPDDPTIDAGVVSYQLTVTKKLNGTGVRHAGDTVTYTIVVHNDGPADALNWTVTDALPDQLTLVSMTGSGYDCTGTTCTATGHLPAGADAAPITVTATIKAGVTKSFSNVAVVKPEPRIPDVPDNDAPTPVEPVNPLPHTGSDLTPLTGAGLALLLLGALSVALTRRQKRREAR